jgi:hypothetical protein
MALLGMVVAVAGCVLALVFVGTYLLDRSINKRAD